MCRHCRGCGYGSDVTMHSSLALISGTQRRPPTQARHIPEPRLGPWAASAGFFCFPYRRAFLAGILLSVGTV